MTVPVAALLAFSVWTLLLLGATVGVYRWSRVFAGQATVREWRGDRPQGSDWYLRALRAHANCIENLPVFAAIVVAAHLTGVSNATMNGLAVVIVLARVAQSITHVAFRQTEAVAITRFSLFFIQVLSMLAMAGLVAVQATATLHPI